MHLFVSVEHASKNWKPGCYYVFSSVHSDQNLMQIKPEDKDMRRQICI